MAKKKDAYLPIHQARSSFASPNGISDQLGQSPTINCLCIRLFVKHRSWGKGVLSAFNKGMPVATVWVLVAHVHNDTSPWGTREHIKLILGHFVLKDGSLSDKDSNVTVVVIDGGLLMLRRSPNVLLLIVLDHLLEVFVVLTSICTFVNIIPHLMSCSVFVVVVVRTPFFVRFLFSAPIIYLYQCPLRRIIN